MIKIAIITEKDTIWEFTAWEKTIPFLKKMLGADYFYYLLHPAGLMVNEDLETTYIHSLQSMNIPLVSIIKIIEEVFELIADSNRPIITMNELSDSYKEKYIKCN